MPELNFKYIFHKIQFKNFLKSLKYGRGKLKLAKYSPKLIELMQWKYVEEVNKMLDKGISPLKVHAYIVENGFEISHTLVYQYAKLRKQAIAEGYQMEKLIAPIPIRVPIILNKEIPETQAKINKVKSELDILDTIIQQGFSSLDRYFRGMPIPLKTTLDAISLKNKITDGTHMFLTNYGIEHLKKLEQAKFQVILEVMMSFIPEETHTEVIAAIEKAEDEYYKNTDYYEDYLKAKEGE